TQRIDRARFARRGGGGVVAVALRVRSEEVEWHHGNREVEERRGRDVLASDARTLPLDAKLLAAAVRVVRDADRMLTRLEVDRLALLGGRVIAVVVDQKPVPDPKPRAIIRSQVEAVRARTLDAEKSGELEAEAIVPSRKVDGELGRDPLSFRLRAIDLLDHSRESALEVAVAKPLCASGRRVRRERRLELLAEEVDGDRPCLPIPQPQRRHATRWPDVRRADQELRQPRNGDAAGETGERHRPRNRVRRRGGRAELEGTRESFPRLLRTVAGDAANRMIETPAELDLLEVALDAIEARLGAREEEIGDAAHGSLALVLIEASKERGHRASRLHRLRIGDQFLEVASRRARSHIPEHRPATWEDSILARAGGMTGRAPELTEEELASLEPGNLEAGRRRHRRLRGERSIGRGHRERTHDEEARCRPARDDVNGFRRPIPWDTAPRAADTLRSSHVSSPWRVARSVARWTRRACG